MELKRDSVWVKAFFFSYRLWLAFADSPDDIDDRVDVCRFVRTTFLWGPLVLAAQIGLWGFAAYVLLLAPLLTFGVPYLWLIAAAFGIVGVALFVSGVREQLLVLRSMAEPLPPRFDDRPAKKGWFSEIKEILAAYYRAFKDRFCPIIEIKET